MDQGRRLLDRLSEAASVRRAFGDPVERDGSVIIPVARVIGGGGGGEGGQPGAEGEQGYGGGFGLRVSPVGVFVVREDSVTWQPAVDVSRIVLGGQILGAIVLFTIRSMLRRRARRVTRAG
jgi:uncharacterized spore protein YtfJ